MTDEAKKDFTLRITQANKSGLVVILYEMYLAYLDDAVQAADDRQAYKEGLRKARGCLNELINSLDFHYDLARRLFQLYIYIGREMALAEAKGNAEPLADCRKIIDRLLEAYREASRSDTSGPVMENTQTVYAGLTYGKGELTENLSHEGNRGFLI